MSPSHSFDCPNILCSTISSRKTRDRGTVFRCDCSSPRGILRKIIVDTREGFAEQPPNPKTHHRDENCSCGQSPCRWLPSTIDVTLTETQRISVTVELCVHSQSISRFYYDCFSTESQETQAKSQETQATMFEEKTSTVTRTAVVTTDDTTTTVVLL